MLLCWKALSRWIRFHEGWPTQLGGADCRRAYQQDRQCNLCLRCVQPRALCATTRNYRMSLIIVINILKHRKLRSAPRSIRSRCRPCGTAAWARERHSIALPACQGRHQAVAMRACCPGMSPLRPLGTGCRSSRPQRCGRQRDMLVDQRLHPMSCELLSVRAVRQGNGRRRAACMRTAALPPSALRPTCARPAPTAIPRPPPPRLMQVNLFLRIMRRREDGYHDLASLFHVRRGVACMAPRQHSRTSGAPRAAAPATLDAWPRRTARLPQGAGLCCCRARSCDASAARCGGGGGRLPPCRDAGRGTTHVRKPRTYTRLHTRPPTRPTHCTYPVTPR